MQPERLTVFDKWFSHEFAVPVPGVPGRHTSGQSGRPSAGVLVEVQFSGRDLSFIVLPSRTFFVTVGVIATTSVPELGS